LERETAKVGLKINEQKTKYMIAARNDTTIRDVGQSVAIGDKHFEVVKEFVYLGSLMTPTNDVSLELQRRIQTANRCFFALRKHLQSSHLSRQTKFTIHKTLISPVLLYGSETWVLTKREGKALFRAKPIGRRNQGRPKSRWAHGMNSDSLALGVRDWTHCAQDRQSWKDILGQALTKYWLPHK
jgi:hypothetical protein